MLPWSGAGPLVLLTRTVAVLYQKYIPLSSPHWKKKSCSGKEAGSVWSRKGDDGVRILSE